MKGEGLLGPRLSGMSLFWRVFAVNAFLVTLAVVLLAVTPLTVSDPATSQQLVYLGVSLCLLLAANVLLLRVSLRPLVRLTVLMRRTDLLRPGERLAVAGANELQLVLVAFNEMLDRLERERRVSSSRTLDREEEEQRRLAGELHDEVGQGLTALLLELRAALADLPEGQRRHVLQAQAIARENLDEVRRIARTLRPSLLDDLGLAYAVHALADLAEEQAGLDVNRQIDTGLPALNGTTELAVYRIAQEAITNTIRHAEASRIDVVLQRTASGLRLEVRDHGRGMLYAREVEGGGIRGMRERALAVGASLQIESEPGAGTSVAVLVPGAG